MEESLEVSDVVNHRNFCSNDNGVNDNEMQDASLDDSHTKDVPCNNKTAIETVTAEEMPEAGLTENMEQANTEALQTSDASPDANDAHEDIQTAAASMNDTADVNKHLDAEQPSINGTESAQQSDELKSLDVSLLLTTHQNLP